MKKIISLCLALLMCLCLVPAMADYADAVYSTARTATLYTVNATSGAYSNGFSYVVTEENVLYTGSAFAVGCDDDEVRYFVTNAHNLSNTAEFEVIIIDNELYEATGSLKLSTVQEGTLELPATPTLYLIFDTAEELAKVDVLKISNRTDLAVVELQVPTDQRKPMTLRPFEDADEIRNADVYSVGFPGAARAMLDAEHYSLMESNPDSCVIRPGMVSNLLGHNQTQTGEVVGHSATINGGNSGGPLVDQDGNVLGVNTWGINGEEGLYYSVSVNEVIRILDDLDIEYRTASTFPIALVIGAALAVLVVALVLALALRNRKSGYLLVGVAGDLRGKAYPLYKTTLIGRSGSAQIRYPETSDGVSGKHCTVTVKGKTITVTDTSSHGTWIDNVKLIPGVATPITQGQTIFFGSAKHGMMLK